MNIYDDFCVIRKKKIKKDNLRVALENILNRVERDEAYGYWGLLKRLLKIKLGLAVSWINKKNLPVCSDVAISFLKDLGCKSYENVSLPSPQDIRRYVDKYEVDVLFEKNITT